MALPANWVEYKTKDGKEYYYNTITKATQWERPSGAGGPPASRPPPLPTKPSRGSSSHSKGQSVSSGSSSSSSSTSSSSRASSSGAGGASNNGKGGSQPAAPVNLLAEIRGGAKLKKVQTVEKGTGSVGQVSGGAGGGGGGGGGSSRASVEPPVRSSISSSGGGGAQEDMMAAIRNAKLRPTGNKERLSAPGPSSVSGGSPRKAWESPFNKSPGLSGGAARNTIIGTSSGSLGGNGGSDKDEGSTQNLESRLASIEEKLDKIMSHLNIS